MPDQPGKQPPGAVAEEEQPEIGPAEPYLQPGADKGDLPAHAQTGLSRSNLRAAIRSVYRSPHPAVVAPEPEPEIPPNPYGEEFSQPEEPTKLVEEYSIPAPAEFSPRAEKPGNPPGGRLETLPEQAAGPMADEEFEVPFEETNPNPTLAEEPTLSTVELETYAHLPEPEEFSLSLSQEKKRKN